MRNNIINISIQSKNLESKQQSRTEAVSRIRQTSNSTSDIAVSKTACVLRIVSLAMLRYACCKHGPAHRMPGCGFAHVLSEVDPPSSIQRKFWKDTTHIPGGHAAIDMFFGQTYTVGQLGRILNLVYNEPMESLPPWAKQLVWFLRLRPAEYFLRDDDFGLPSRIRLLAIEQQPEETGYPFDLQMDSEGVSLFTRMDARMSTAFDATMYRCLQTWNCSGCAEATSMHWGSHSRQYLSLDVNREYFKIGASEPECEWWYVVAVDNIKMYLHQGGWAPPAFLKPTGRMERLYELRMPVLRADEQEYVVENNCAPANLAQIQSSPQTPPEYNVERPIPGNEFMSEDELHVYTDGSTSCYNGIAAAWLYRGEYYNNYASIAGFFKGSEAAEILGITGALLSVLRFASKFKRYVFWIDSANAIQHIFGNQQVSSAAGEVLLPGIMLCRYLHGRLADLGIRIQHRKVHRKENLAHRLAYAEQRRRLKAGWRRDEDFAPEYMPEELLKEF